MTSPSTLLKARNLRARKEAGQHFLARPETADWIAESCALVAGEVVVEIGSGLGALTVALARRATEVIAVEKDGRLIELLRNELAAADVSNVTIVQEDILRLDWGAFCERFRKPLVVAGNLPYNISSQIVVRLVENRSGIHRAVLMFQKEMAERITAPPGGKTYGRLSVLAQYAATVHKVADVPASLFYPRPKIDSQVLSFRFTPFDPSDAEIERHLSRVVRAAFSKRRKTLKNALAASDFRLHPETARRILTESEIDPERRAETLSVEEFVRLAGRLRSALPKP